MAEIKVPTTAVPGAKLSVGRWFKRVGDAVAAQEPLVEIFTDGVTHELSAPVAGMLSTVVMKDGQTVQAGAVLGTIDDAV
jgi:2-oxoglutarate dehydrogenase E2 component (dihydrolipoamide succinyltransferase)